MPTRRRAVSNPTPAWLRRLTTPLIKMMPEDDKTSHQRKSQWNILGAKLTAGKFEGKIDGKYLQGKYWGMTTAEGHKSHIYFPKV